MFKAIINLFKSFKPTPVELKVEDTIKVEEPIAVVTEPVPTPHTAPLPRTVVEKVSDWPFPTQAPAEKVKAKPVKKPAKPSTTKTNSKQAPKPVYKGK